jgi:hypothetical protein
MQAVTISHAVNEPSHNHFRAGVLASNPPHKVAALFRCQSVGHMSRAAVEIVSPLLHHLPPLGEVLRVVVGGAHVERSAYQAEKALLCPCFVHKVAPHWPAVRLGPVAWQSGGADKFSKASCGEAIKLADEVSA